MRHVQYMQAGDASGTGLLNVMKKQWDKEAVSLVDERIAGWLPQLVGPDEASAA
jgi:sugar (pentulose or hexulose) kinase